MTYEVWRLVAVKDASTSTWELAEQFSNFRLAQRYIQEQAGAAIISSEDNLFSFEDSAGGEHYYRIEAAFAPAGQQPRGGPA